MSPLEVWYDRLDAQTIIEMAPDVEIKRIREKTVAKAIGEFALAYADQNESDYESLVEAMKVGQIEALVEEEAD